MIGIDISDRSIKVVRLSDTLPRRLLSHGWGIVPERVLEKGVITDANQMKDALLKTFKNCDVPLGKRDTVVASIPEAESFLRVVEIPNMDESEVGEAVQWEVAQHLPFGLDKVYLDWQWVRRSADGGKSEVLVGAAEKALVDQLWSVLSELNFDVAALELESQAIVRSLISAELKEKEGLLIVDLGSAATNVVIHDRGTVRFTATLRRGIGAIIAQLPAAERQQLENALSEGLNANIDPFAAKLSGNLQSLVAEVYGIVEFYAAAASGRRINEILLAGGGANLPGLEEVFLRTFSNVHVQRGNPWVNLVVSQQSAKMPMSLREAVHYTTAIGLALRPEEPLKG